jgi:hypothetical protein
VELLDILKQHKVLSIVGSKHSGKTTSLINFIDCVKKSEFRSWCFAYHQETRDLLSSKFEKLKFFGNLNELEQIQEGFVFIDEFHQLFNTENRHNKEILQSVFNQLEHKNIVVVICGTTEYYNKLICSFIPDDNYVLCGMQYKDFVQGSQLKKYVLNLGTNLKGGTCFNVPIGKVFYKGELVNIKYDSKTDKKAKRVNLFEGL